MLIGSYNLGILKLPEFVEDLFGLNEGDGEYNLQEGEQNLYHALLNAAKNENESTILEYNVTSESLLKTIVAAQTPEEYSAIYTITRKSGKTELIETVHIWKKGDRYIVRKSDEDNVTKSELYNNGETVEIKTYASDKPTIYTYPASDSFTIESDAGIPQVTAFLLDENVKDLEITLRQAIDYHLYHAQYGYRDSDVKETTYILLEHNMVLHSETVLNGDSIYACALESIETEITGIDFPE